MGLVGQSYILYLIIQDNYSSLIVHTWILTRLMCSHACVSDFTQYTVINHYFNGTEMMDNYQQCSFY